MNLLGCRLRIRRPLAADRLGPHPAACQALYSGAEAKSLSLVCQRVAGLSRALAEDSGSAISVQLSGESTVTWQGAFCLGSARTSHEGQWIYRGYCKRWSAMHGSSVLSPKNCSYRDYRAIAILLRPPSESPRTSRDDISLLPATHARGRTCVRSGFRRDTFYP